MPDCPIPASSQVLAYLRYSTGDQSIDSQLAAVRKFAEQHDLYLDEDLIFVDEAQSGGRVADRQAFMRLIETTQQYDPIHDARAPRWILLWNYKRFAREFNDTMLYVASLRSRGWDIHSISDNIPEGDIKPIAEALIWWAAQRERRDIKQDTWRGQINRLEEGHVIVSLNTTPYGYRYITKAEDPDDNGYLEIYEPEAEAIRYIFELAAAGETQYRIAQKLNKETEFTPPGNGSKWRQGTLSKMLRSETYAGIWHWNKSERWVDGEGNAHRTPKPKEEWIPVEVPAIVSREMWERTQRAIGRNHQGRTSPHYDYWLRGHIFCDRCSHNMSGHSHKVDDREYYYYRCNHARRAGKGTCPQRMIRASLLEERLWTHIIQIASDPDWWKKFTTEQSDDDVIQRLENRIRHIDAQIDELRNREQRAYELYIDFGGDSHRDRYQTIHDEVSTQIPELHRQRLDLKRQLERHTIDESQLETFTGLIEQIDELHDADRDIRRQILALWEIDIRIHDKTAWLTALAGRIPLGRIDLFSFLNRNSHDSH